MPSRIIVRTELSPSAKQHIERLCDEFGMTQLSLTSRVIEWFAKQDQITQRNIAGHIPPELQKQITRFYSKKRK